MCTGTVVRNIARSSPQEAILGNHSLIATPCAISGSSSNMLELVVSPWPPSCPFPGIIYSMSWAIVQYRIFVANRLHHVSPP